MFLLHLRFDVVTDTVHANQSNPFDVPSFAKTDRLDAAFIHPTVEDAFFNSEHLLNVSHATKLGLKLRGVPCRVV